MTKKNVAILGATGAVGSRLIKCLEQSSIDVNEIKLLASKRSAGETLKFDGEDVIVKEATPDEFDGIDLVLASAGGSVSKKFLPEAVKRGAVCVDNTSAFRMEKDVPLVIPEVNSDALKNHHGIIANPNCSTIQMVLALNPIREKYGLRQVIVSTYQAASGAGQSAINELKTASKQYIDGENMDANIFPVKSDEPHYPLAFNLLPQIDVFEENGYTHEEWKMIHETKKILLNDMNSKKIKVTATCVRVPVEIGHGEAVYFETESQEPEIADLKSLIEKGSGLVLEDNPKKGIYPQPINAAGKNETFVGRLRKDEENPGNYHMWVVSDNLLKGAALNTVQIAEKLVEMNLV